MATRLRASLGLAEEETEVRGDLPSGGLSVPRERYSPSVQRRLDQGREVWPGDRGSGRARGRPEHPMDGRLKASIRRGWWRVCILRPRREALSARHCQQTRTMERWQEGVSLVRGRGSIWTDLHHRLGRGRPLHRHKLEAYNGELAAVQGGLEALASRRGRGVDYTIFTNSQADMSRIQSDGPGPEQACRIIDVVTTLYEQGNTVTVGWIPGHWGVAGNEAADLYEGWAAAIDPLPPNGEWVGTAYLKRRGAEKTVRKRREDIAVRSGGRRVFRTPDIRAGPEIRR